MIKEDLRFIKEEKDAKFPFLYRSEAFHIQHVTHNSQKILNLIKQ